jgi:hypothetical protein
MRFSIARRSTWDLSTPVEGIGDHAPGVMQLFIAVEMLPCAQ